MAHPGPGTLLADSPPTGSDLLSGVATCPPSASTDREGPGLERVPRKGLAHRRRSKGHA